NTVTLGNGNDSTRLGNGDNVIVEGNGHDSVTAGNGANLVVAGLGPHNIVLGNGNDILIDGSATLNPAVPNNSFRAILNAWKRGATSATLGSRFTVMYNQSHPSSLRAGSGTDWFLYTAATTTSNRKPGDSRN